MNVYDLLSPDILDKANKKSGNELGWKLNDVPSVLLDAKRNNLASIGGQLQYIFSDGTCELYWQNIDSGKKHNEETWEKWVERSYNICLKNFKKLVKNNNFIKEANNSFEFIKEKIDKGVDVKENEYFILYFDKKPE